MLFPTKQDTRTSRRSKLATVELNIGEIADSHRPESAGEVSLNSD